MKSVLVIGLGSFGRFAAHKFAQLGNDVMVVDTDERAVNDILPYVTSAQIADCTNEQVLRSFGVDNFDICLVAVGENFQSSLEITSLLKDLGAPYVVSKATRDIQAKFLLRNGADSIVYPDKDMAENLAVRASSDNIFECIDLTPQLSIYEISPPKAWLGKTVRQVDVRRKYDLTILASKDGDNVVPITSPDYTFREDHHLMVLAKEKDIHKLRD